MQPDHNQIPEPAASPAPQFAAQFDGPPAPPAASQAEPQAPAPGERAKFPSAFALFRPSSQLVMKNLANFVAVLLLPSAYFVLLEQFFNPKTANQHTAVWLGLAGVGVIYNLLVFAAVPVLELRTVQGQQFRLFEVIKLGWRYFWRILGIYIVIGVVVCGGILLFIVPGIIMIRRYTLAPYFMIDQNVGIFEAMRRSAAATKGYTGAVWGLIGVQVLLGVSGWIPFIGPFISAAVGMFYGCAQALRYEQFKALHAATAPAPVQPAGPPNPTAN